MATPASTSARKLVLVLADLGHVPRLTVRQPVVVRARVA